MPFRIYDQNNIAADISSYIREDRNSIRITVKAEKDWHGVSDPLYLLGDFGVNKQKDKFTIGKVPQTAAPSAKTVSGFPFYSGKFFFETNLDIDNPGNYAQFTVELPEKYRIYECVDFSVNGIDLGVRCFSPYIWHGPASLLKKGKNPVKMAISNTLGNMLEACYFDYDEQKTIFFGADTKDD